MSDEPLYPRNTESAGTMSIFLIFFDCPRTEGRTIAVDRRLEMASSEDEQIVEEARMVWRCPFEGCPEASVASAGWLQRGALISHVNAVHLSLPGVGLPADFEKTAQLCPRCRLIVTSRGCAACQENKAGRVMHLSFAWNLMSRRILVETSQAYSIH